MGRTHQPFNTGDVVGDTSTTKCSSHGRDRRNRSKLRTQLELFFKVLNNSAKTKRDTTRQEELRYKKTRQDKRTRQDRTGQNKTRQEKKERTRHNNTKENKTRGVET